MYAAQIRRHQDIKSKVIFDNFIEPIVSDSNRSKLNDDSSLICFI